MTLVKVPAGMSLQQARNRLGSHKLPGVLLSDGISGTDRPAVTFTASATPHTVGAWAQIVSSLSADVGWVRLIPASTTGVSGADSSVLFNLGVGAASSEVTVMDALGVGWFNLPIAPPHPGWLFPLFIPRGSRVAGQIQSVVASKTAALRVEFFAVGDGPRPTRKVTALGANLAASRGLVLSVGAAGAEGSWTEVIASTSESYTALGLSFQGAADTTQTSTSALVDIAIGPSGFETPIISDVLVSINGQEAVTPQSPLIHPVNVPAGSRLAARLAIGNSTSALDVTLHGIPPAA